MLENLNLSLSLSPFALSHIINFFMALVIGLFVYLKNRKAQVNITFFIMTLFVACWALFWFLSQMTKEGEGLFYTRVQNLFGLFIPAFYLHFILSLINKIKEKKKILLSVYVLNILILIVAVVFPSLFLVGVGTKLGIPNYPAQKSILFYIYTFFFFAESFYGILQLLKIYPRISGVKKDQIKYTIVSSLFGFLGGGSVFILGYDVPIYPWPNFLMSLWVVILATAIIRYRLMEIETVIHKTMLWLATSVLVFIPISLLLLLLWPWLKSLSPWASAAVVVLSFFGFLWYYHRIQPRIDHFFQRRRFDPYQVLFRVVSKVSSQEELEGAVTTLNSELKTYLYSRNLVAYIQDEETGEYKLEQHKGYEEV